MLIPNQSLSLTYVYTLPFCFPPPLSPSGYELLYQPEVVRIYTSLLKESKNPTVLEASAGAIQNLCAGRWTVRAAVICYYPILFHSDTPCVEQTHQLSYYGARLWESEQS